MIWTNFFNEDVLNIKDTYLEKISKAENLKYMDLLKLKEEKFLEEIEEIKSLVKLNIDFSEDSLKLLKIQKKIITNINKYSLKNLGFDDEFMISVLEYLLKISDELRKRLNMDLLDEKITNTIHRSSYKFCKFKEACCYNYSLKNKGKCYQHHYVHNMVMNDIKQLIKFFQKKYTCDVSEAIKTINTIYFVICHMENELSTRCLYLKPDEISKIEDQHYNK